MASIVTLAPARLAQVPMAQPQGQLDLRLDQTPELPALPPLRLAGADERLERLAARFAQAIVEVIGGDRGAHQLMRWTTDAVYADLLRRVQVLQSAVPKDQRIRRVRAQVRSVHLSRPRPGIAELSIHVRHGHRSRAIAARIEYVEGRWRCSVLDFG